MSTHYMKGHGENLPPVSRTLIEELDKIFQAKEFNPSNSKDEMMYHYGQRSVITFLLHHLKIQQDNILNPKE